MVPPSISIGDRGRWVSTNVGVWNGGLGPHQPFQSASSCQPGGPNLFAPMISAPMPGPNCWANALSTPSPPPVRPIISAPKRVANIHSCSRWPAWPKGVSSDWPSPVANPSSDIARLWIRVRLICTLHLLGCFSGVETVAGPRTHRSGAIRLAPIRSWPG